MWISGWHFQGKVYAAAAAAKSLQSCPTLCDPMDCSPPGSSVHGLVQERVLQWVAIERFIILCNLDILSSNSLVCILPPPPIFLTFYGSLLFRIISKRQVLYLPFFPLDFSP